MLIKVKVAPGSGEDRIEKIDEENYRVFVKASAQNGHANKVVTYLLSKYFGKSVKMASGGTRPNKIFEVL